ncbi:polysaccharide deacetylase family protein [Geothermobacter hydrogeniphilus]|uniref:Phosphotyrosine protein phosphatase I domain-containing protein n=1 Tax=Geothermobacter hydrogeniphilus TaxID=1969733 RepID=A0A1X0YE80_9BACT|nr:polysaccharide deacetylase family protein [Geothermobacter hydrogeniphilus]ORJ63402.1 hypothetical protein B5V00_00620 [Geothermobacter hydrogeniphilus]
MKGVRLKPSIKRLLGSVVSTAAGRKLVNRCSPGFATVFLLHRAAGIHPGIHGHDPEGLEQILIGLKKRRFNLVPLDAVVSAARGTTTLPNQSVAFTMDDGYWDQLEVLAPVFVRHGVPLTVFLTTGLLDGELWPWDAKIHWLMMRFDRQQLEIPVGRQRICWPTGSAQERRSARRELQAIAAAISSEQLPSFLSSLEDAVGIKLPKNAPEEFQPASWDQVRSLEAEGVRFAPHTHSHRILSRLSEEGARRELLRSLDRVRSCTKQALPVMAYPVGMEAHFGSREMTLAKGLGYAAAFSVCGEYLRWKRADGVSDSRCYSIPRYALPSKISDAMWIAGGVELFKWSSVSLMSHMGELVYGHGRRTGRVGRRVFLRSQLRKLALSLGQYSRFREIDPGRIKRLVFVCRGNVCRSPYAEKVAQRLGFPAVSCGTEVLHSSPAEQMAVRAALMRGEDLSEHMSKSIFDNNFQYTDCLIVMDPSQIQVAQKVADRVNCQVSLLGMWNIQKTPEIYDPYGRSIESFNECFMFISNCIDKLVLHLNSDNGMVD